MAIREEVIIHAQANARTFREFMVKERLKVCLFNIGPYAAVDGASAVVGLTVELLEADGYKVDVTPQILALGSGPGQPMTGLTVLVVRAPVIVMA
jgi:hypothetical protein